MNGMVTGDTIAAERSRILAEDAFRWLDSHPAPPYLPATGGTSGWDAAERNATVPPHTSTPAPHHASRGLNFGAFRAFPEISSTVRWDDNVYKTATNTRSDTITQIKSAMKLLTHWAQNRLEGNLEANIKRYQELKTEDNTDQKFSLNAHLAPTRRVEFDLSVSRSLEHDERGEPGKASVQTPSLFSAPVGPNAWQQDSFKGTSRLKLRRLTTEFSLGHAERISLNNNQFTQDHTWNDATLLFRWALTPKTSLLAEIGQKETVYDVSPKLDNTETRLLAGISWKATARTESQTKIGITNKSLTNAQGKNNRSLTWNSTASWQPQSRTRFNFVSNRSMQMSEDQNEAYVSSGVQFGIKHTLAVDWDLLASVDLNQSVYETAKEENFWTSKAGMEYKLPNWFSVGTEFVRKTKQSTVVGGEYGSNALMFTLTGAL
ncbi:MAG: outer membrane beta-barrel protein [Magnetococcales bacterium]|nr:outer membrane beta-barrel protein [Magnetococcales bacterium]